MNSTVAHEGDFGKVECSDGSCLWQGADPLAQSSPTRSGLVVHAQHLVNRDDRIVRDLQCPLSRAMCYGVRRTQSDHNRNTKELSGILSAFDAHET